MIKILYLIPIFITLLACGNSSHVAKDSKDTQDIYNTFSKELLEAQLDSKKACEKDIADACIKLALSHQLNDTATKEEIYRIYNKASKLYDIGCTNGNMSNCASLGALYEAGDGVTRDIAKSRRLYKLACDGNNKAGCLNLALEILSCVSCETLQKRMENAIIYLNKACKLGSQSACHLEQKSKDELESNTV